MTVKWQYKNTTTINNGDDDNNNNNATIKLIKK